MPTRAGKACSRTFSVYLDGSESSSSSSSLSSENTMAWDLFNKRLHSSNDGLEGFVDRSER